LFDSQVPKELIKSNYSIMKLMETFSCPKYWVWI